MSEQVADVADAAADYMEQFGWQQRAMGSIGSKVCAVGAIRVVTMSAESLDEATKAKGLTKRLAVTEAVALLVHPDWDEWGAQPTRVVTTWNDQPGRTEQEVLDALRAAAKAERQAGESA